jgi:DNA-binding LytR/AlgR family response regulator
MDGRVREHLTQVHKSFAVNMRQVTGYSSGELFIHAHCIPVGRAFCKEVKELFVNST